MSKEVYNTIQNEIESLGFMVVSKDFERPWGAFLVIDENRAHTFYNQFFEGIDVDHLKIEGKLNPKNLIVKSGASLSWQYHHRCAEIWQVYREEVGIIRNDTNQQGDVMTYSADDQGKLRQGERHRLFGLKDFGIVAEIWQHTDSVPSDEDDIVRVQDDFKRD